MARDPMTAVENIDDPFGLPTPTEGDDVYNSGDGMYFTELPGRPATIGLINRTGGGGASVTFSVSPTAPGGAAAAVVTISSNAGCLVLPPGWLPAHLFRRDDGQETHPGTIYVDASAAGFHMAVVRGPAGYTRKRGAGGAGSIGGSRTLWTPSVVAPLVKPAEGVVITDTDGVGFPYSGDEAMLIYRGAGTQTLTITRNPNDPFGGSANITIASNANAMIVLPPGVPHPDLVRRDHGTDTGFIYLSSDQAASTRLCVARLSGLRA